MYPNFDEDAISSNRGQTPLPISGIKRLKDNTEELEKQFSPLNAYLWFHGYGFTEKLQCSCRSLVIWTLSFLMCVLKEVNDFYLMYSKIKHNYIIDERITKADISASVVYCFEAIQRFQLYSKRKQIKQMIQDLSKLGVIVSRGNSFNFRQKLAIILFIYDVATLSITLTFISTFSYPSFGYLGDDYMFGDIPAPYSTTFAYISPVLSYWISSPLAPIAALVSTQCYVLKMILMRLKERLCQEPNINIDESFQIYTEVTNLASRINDTYHTMLFSFFVTDLWIIFYLTYFLVFNDTPATNAYICITIVEIIPISLLFICVCLFSSSVTKAAKEVKKAVYHLDVEELNWSSLRFLQKIQDELIEFKLLDSIVINKQLFLTAMASLFTYGIMIATFKSNTKEDTG